MNATNQNTINNNDNGVLNQQNQVIQTEIAQVSVVPAVVETSNFQAVLQEIPQRVNEANQLLQSYRDDKDSFLENIDEETLDAHLKQMGTVTSFVRDIEKSRKEIRSYMNGIRDTLIQTLDERLQAAQYNELERAQADIKQLKQDLDAERRNKRWEELRPTFEANVNRYPLIGEFAPELADFSRFRLLNPKLISGAKTRKVREKDHTFVNETIFAWNTAIEIMKENEWGLSPHDLNQLLTMFKQNPSVELVQREGRQLKINAEAQAKAQAEAEARRKEQERLAQIEAQKRAEELARIQEAEAKAKAARDAEAQRQAEEQRKALEERARIAEEQERKRQAELAQFGGQYRTIFKESFPLFIEYLFSRPDYHDVHSNDVTKTNVVYDIMMQAAHQPNSVVAQETGRNPKKILELVRYILDA